uniref:Uncharacterized protein n=1 Tax=Aegilops tauschii subsp. strangulata TaxID=200361 RepID=A0A453HSA5_AEGTS
EAAAAAQAEEDLLRDFERILHDDPLMKMVLSTNFNLSHLKDELRLCALILSYSPKNESTWSHRRWVIKNLAQHLQDMPELIDKESLLVKDMAEKSKMNYRAWRHRCWLIPYMKTKQVLDELNKSKKWAELHVADNCSFHYRRSLLLALLDGAANREDSLICQSEAYLMWKEELRWNETLIRRYQGREVCACGESKVVLLLGVVTDS